MFCFVFIDVTYNYNYVYATSIKTKQNKTPRSWAAYVKIRLVATCHLQTCCNLLKLLAANLWITSFDNQLSTSLTATCNTLVLNKLSQAMPTHPIIYRLLDQVLVAKGC